MSDYSRIESLLLDLHERTPVGFALAFHINYTASDFIFQTYPSGWRKVYSESGMVLQDPIVAWCFANTGWIRWSDLAANDPAGVLSRAKDYGMNYGVAFACEGGGTRSVSGYAHASREFTDEEIAAYATDTTRLHEWTARNNLSDPADRERLRQLSVRFTHSDQATQDPSPDAGLKKPDKK
ncbi:MAG: transcriptional regulator [Limimaricola sp.]|uniref:autoinducer binding domain-containing protein n=1 Tax=Limimaricola sp. TaxID=2211665 RepID=UPI001DB0DA90|nr:autoinducer binding domain-containing protein [Limimaricola sp.]MBI1416649.1 transcriptional regulator [Limimaricola sp.]